MYDYWLGGVHNFPADQEAARRILELYPDTALGAQSNRAFMRRAVQYMADAGIRQFLDIGSGIPTQGNVHEIAQQSAPESRVAYVDIDTVAVAEGLELLADNPAATAIRADLRDPGAILAHPQLGGLLDLAQPTGLLLCAVLHFISDDDHPYGVVADLVDALAPGSYLAVSHVAAEAVGPASSSYENATGVYRRRTTSAVTARSHAEVERFFTGLELVDPGVVWHPLWRPEPGAQDPFQAEPERSLGWAGVARKPTPAGAA